MFNLDWKFAPLFAPDGGAVGGEGGADAGAQGEDAVSVNPNRRQRKGNPLANVRYGIQPEQPKPEEPAPAPEGKEEPADLDAEWDALKKGKFKDYFGRDTENIIKERLKKPNEAKAQMEKLAPVLENLAQKYGIKDVSDIDGLVAAYTNDDSLYAEEAEKRGMDIPTLKVVKQLETEKAQREAQDRQNAIDQRNQAHLQNLVQQSEALKQAFPSFDLVQEFQNPQFVRLTSPEVGISVEDAYHLIHRKEIQAASAQVIAEKAQQKLSQATASGMRRPSENGSQSVSPALDIRDDPSKWSKADREEVKRRVRMGERILL